MSASLFCCLRLLVVIMTLVSCLRAQPDGTSMIEVRFFSRETPAKDLYYRAAGKDYQLITAPAYRLGPPIRVEAGQPLVLSQKKTVDGRETYDPVLRITLPPDASRVRVALLPPTADAPAAYRSLTVPDDFKHFGAGQILAFNLSPLPAVVRVGETNHPLAPLESKVFTPPSFPRHRISVKSGVQVSGQWQIAGSEVLGLPPGYRATLMVTISETIGYEEGKSDARPIAFSESEWVPPLNP